MRIHYQTMKIIQRSMYKIHHFFYRQFLNSLVYSFFELEFEPKVKHDAEF